jgi:hypothetical protein
MSRAAAAAAQPLRGGVPSAHLMKYANRIAPMIASLFALTSAAASDPLSPLDFLLGKWSGGAPGAVGTDLFQRKLDGHVLQRSSQSMSRASDGKSRGSRQALLTVYPAGDSDALAAIYFDNEGHVIHYNRVTVTPGKTVEFLSDGAERGPSFRLTYALKTRGVLHVKFEMAPPGESTYRNIAEADEAATP